MQVLAIIHVFFYFPLIDIRLIQVGPRGTPHALAPTSKRYFSCLDQILNLLKYWVFFVVVFLLLFLPLFILDFIYLPFLWSYIKLLLFSYLIFWFLFFNFCLDYTILFVNLIANLNLYCHSFVTVFIEFQGEELNKQCLLPFPSLNLFKNISYYVYK